MAWLELCLAASALSHFFVFIAWRRRFRGLLGNGKLRIHSVDFSAHPVPAIVVAPTDMRRPDDSKMSFLRLRSPKDKDSVDFDRLKSPIGTYTGEPMPLPKPSQYPWKTVATLLGCVGIACLSITGCLNQIAPAIFPPAPQILQTSLWLKNGKEGVVPEYPRVKKMFTNDRSFQDTGVQGDAAWRDMLPKGHGVVELRWPEHLKMPKPALYHDSSLSPMAGIELAEVSVVKELDCLIKIRSALVGYEYNMDLTRQMKIEVHACLDYGKFLESFVDGRY
jgi:hypothetical protein